MKALIGVAVGAVIGWVVGYLMVVTRIERLDNSLAQGIGYALAPPAPDTILCAVLGALLGCLGHLRGNAKTAKGGMSSIEDAYAGRT